MVDTTSVSLQTTINETTSAIDKCTSLSELNALSAKSLSALKVLNDTVSELQAEFDKTQKMIQDFFTDQLAEVLKSVNKLLPLLTPPTDIGSAITWITNMISNIQVPYDKLIAVQAQLALKQTETLNKMVTLTSNIVKLSTNILSKIKSLEDALLAKAKSLEEEALIKAQKVVKWIGE